MTYSTENLVLDAINRFIPRFQENPFSFLLESDLQCAFFAELRSGIGDTVTVPSVTADNENYVLTPIYSEYGRHRIDLVCLDTDKISRKDASSFKPHRGKDTYIYDLPVLVGIEIKYVYMGYSKGFNILRDDYGKLCRIDNLPYKFAICFLQTNEIADVFLKDVQRNTAIQQLDRITSLDGMYAVSPKTIVQAGPVQSL